MMVRAQDVHTAGSVWSRVWGEAALKFHPCTLFPKTEGSTNASPPITGRGSLLFDQTGRVASVPNRRSSALANLANTHHTLGIGRACGSRYVLDQSTPINFLTLSTRRCCMHFVYYTET